MLMYKNYKMEYFAIPLIFITTILAPIVFPRLFWKKTDEKIKVVFYNIVKKSENPYIDEPTSISLYDPDDQLFFRVDDIYNNESYEELTVLLNRLCKTYDKLYLVTYDIENKEHSFKLITEEILENADICIRFLDLKVLFYSMHPLIPKIIYGDVLEYYRIPKLDCKVVEYCALFEQLVQDYDIDIKNDMFKINNIYKQVKPLQQ
jgi:hypothetical protein